MSSGAITVRFWGVRGSLATSGADFAAVGGNTTCIEVRAGDELIILDAGTGLYPLAQTLPTPVRATFLFSHYHWDHIQGFPFFRPAFVAANEFTIYGLASSDGEVEEMFARQMEPPFFPVPIGTLAAQLTFRALQAGDDFEVGGVRIQTGPLCHPQQCLAYRISYNGASVVFATDTEPPSAGEVDPNVVELARGADVLIHDSQYTEEEYDGRCGPARQGWGHSTIADACRVAKASGVRQLALFHHDPSHTDDFVERMAAAARSLFPHTIIAREGLTLTIGAQQARSRRAA